jgi:hypothetical protein
MNGNQPSPERTKEEEWIAKYRAALDSSIAPQGRGTLLMQFFADFCGKILSSFGRIVYAACVRWQKLRSTGRHSRRSRFARVSQ